MPTTFRYGIGTWSTPLNPECDFQFISSKLVINFAASGALEDANPPVDGTIIKFAGTGIAFFGTNPNFNSYRVEAVMAGNIPAFGQFYLKNPVTNAYVTSSNVSSTNVINWRNGGKPGTASYTYSSIEAWKTATEGANAPVATDRVYIAELYESYTYATATNLQFTLGLNTTDATRYRRLEVPTKFRRNPRIDGDPNFSPTSTPTSAGGVVIKKPISATVIEGILIQEPYFQLAGISLCITGTTGNASVPTLMGAGIRVRSVPAVVDSCFLYNYEQDTSNYPAVGIWCESSPGWATGLPNTNGANHLITNCIVQGSGVDGYGWASGIIATTSNSRVLHCSVNGVRGGAVGVSSFGIGISVGAPAIVTNCIAVGCRTKDFSAIATTSLSYCTSSDSTAILPGATATTGALVNTTADQVFTYAKFRDFRPLNGSQSINTGLATVTQSQGSTAPAFDYFGVARNAGSWNRGAIQEIGNRNTGGATVVELSRASIQAFLNETEHRNLVYENIILVGRITAANDETVSSPAVQWKNRYADDRCYRKVVIDTPNRYDPLSDTGKRLTGSISGFILDVADDNFSIEGGLRIRNNATSGPGGIRLSGSGASAHSLIVQVPSATSGTSHCIEGTGTAQRWRNCVVTGNTGGTGASSGVYVTGSGTRVQNCVAHKFSRGVGVGFRDSGTGTVSFENCISGTCTLGFSTAQGTQRYNVSVDASAVGTNSKPNVQLSSIWADAAANDFRLASNSPAANAGVRLSLEFTTDYNWTTRSSSWEMGIYDGFKVAYPFPAPRPKLVDRKNSAWLIERTDGVVIALTDSNVPVIHRGTRFEPITGVQSSARTKTANLEEHSVEIRAALSSPKLIFDDLLYKRFQGARVTEYLIDSMFPFLKASLSTVYYIEKVSFDGEEASFELTGVSNRLNKPFSEFYQRDCPAVLGDNRCRVNLAAFTKYNVQVTAVDSELAKVRFFATNMTLTASETDNYYSQGSITWRTGANAGTYSEVRIFEAASKGFELYLETSYNIVPGDTFDIVTGCDGAFNTCRTKFNNVVNFRGFPHIPTTDEILRTAGQ